MSEGSSRRRGQRADPGELSERILTAARRSFADNGWAGTTIRGVARDAGVDAALVHYYFADKQELLIASMRLPAVFIANVAQAARSPLDRRGEALMRTQLSSWNDPGTSVVLRSMILTAAHVPAALDRMRLAFSQQLVGAVADHLPAEDRWVRATLVSSQMLGLAMVRYLWRIEPLASLSDDHVVRYLAPTIQRYLAGPLE